MQQFDTDILVSEVVQIRNTKTGCYLTATGFNTSEKGLLFSSTTNINNYFVVGSDDSDNHYTLWTIIKMFDDTNIINYGDIVFLKNISTKMFLMYEFEKLSEVSNQVRASLAEKRQENFPLILQQQGESIFQKKQYKVQNGVPFKLQTTKLTYFLQSLNKNYTSKQVKEYKEISCGKDNDYCNWEIIKLNPEKQQMFEIQPTQKLKLNVQEIFDSDKIIIRNYKTGYSLHSHKNKYTTTGMQEITCYSYERDLNDWWVIQQTFQMASKQIQDQTPINLVHLETIKYLSVDEVNLAKSKNGNQVRGMQSPIQQSFIISTIDNQQLIVGKPFFLFYQPNNKYLCQGPSISEMQQTQYEIIMTDKITTACLWIIEKKIK